MAKEMNWDAVISQLVHAAERANGKSHSSNTIRGELAASEERIYRNLAAAIAAGIGKTQNEVERLHKFL